MAPQSGPHKSVRASQDPRVVRAMVLTPLATPRSGIPSASSVLASLGRQVHPSPASCHRSPLDERQLPKCRNLPLRRAKIGAANTSGSREHLQEIGLPMPQKSAWRRVVVQRSVNATAPLKYLSAERSEDGASGRYTAPWGSEWCQNHCSNHSGFVAGADTFVRSTLSAMAPGGHAFSGAFLLVTFLWQDKEK